MSTDLQSEHAAKPATAATQATQASSGFKLPPPTGVSSGFKLPPPTPAGQQEEFPESNDATQRIAAGAPLPPPTGFTDDTQAFERDSGMFTFSRPGTKAGNSSYYAYPNSRMGTSYAFGYGNETSHGLGGRPLTAFAIPEEQAGIEQNISPAAALAAAYRDGRAIPPTRGTLGTPVIELEERMRSGYDNEVPYDAEASSPSGSGKTEFEWVDST